MPDASLPAPPESLPQYLADGVPKQDTDTLRDLRAYVDALLEYRRQPVDEAALPAEAEPIDGDDDDGSKGTVVKEKVTCGDEACACMNGGEKHGPYLYRYYYADGSLTSEYVGKA